MSEPAHLEPGDVLVEAARHGDAFALEELLRTQRTGVLRVAMKVCISPEDVEDATQEALLSLSRSLSAFRGAARLSTWLFTVTRNHCLRLARRSLRKAAGLEDAGEVASEDPLADELLANAQLRTHLARVLAELEPSQRDLLVRHYVLGEPAVALASRLGISPKAAKSRLHRARTEARGRLFAALATSRSPGVGAPTRDPAPMPKGKGRQSFL